MHYRKEEEPGGKIQHERFNFSSLSFYKDEKETLLVVTLKSRSQMLIRKIQKSKNNLLSTSLIIMITLFKSQIVLAEQERNGYLACSIHSRCQPAHTYSSKVDVMRPLFWALYNAKYNPVQFFFIRTRDDSELQIKTDVRNKCEVKMD